MLTLWGPGEPNRYCDGRSRRSFLKIGGLAMGGLSLPGLLQAEAQGGASRGPSRAAGSSHKSVIMIYLSGGPAHQDTFDLKPDAPDGIRGEFKPIATRLPGVQIGEHAAPDRRRHGQGRRDPLDRRPARRALELPERHRLPDGPEPARGEAQLRVGDRPDARGRSTRSCRRSSTCSRSCSTSRTTAPGRASSATRTRRRGWRATTWRCSSPRPTSRRRGSIAARPCSASSTSSAAGSTTPRSAAWTTSTAAPSTS